MEPYLFAFLMSKYFGGEDDAAIIVCGWVLAFDLYE